jgi:hypothetical protein
MSIPTPLTVNHARPLIIGKVSPRLLAEAYPSGDVYQAAAPMELLEGRTTSCHLDG